MDNWIRDKSFCILYQQKDTEAVTVFLKLSKPTFACFSLTYLIYAASPSSGVCTFYLHECSTAHVIYLDEVKLIQFCTLDSLAKS